ncbi:MAG: preprotein translocase subunit Sec61beta [Methanomassiliicoccales archaeon]|nr:MAG: preprotein translocase subunit Sec61beta [Methanomassiliicoccales archaeon]
MAPPKKSKKSEGFHSAAGLIRYFDSEEESALKLDPRLIVGLCIATVVIVEVINLLTSVYNWW